MSGSLEEEKDIKILTSRIEEKETLDFKNLLKESSNKYFLEFKNKEWPLIKAKVLQVIEQGSAPRADGRWKQQIYLPVLWEKFEEFLKEKGFKRTVISLEGWTVEW